MSGKRETEQGGIIGQPGKGSLPKLVRQPFLWAPIFLNKRKRATILQRKRKSDNRSSHRRWSGTAVRGITDWRRGRGKYEASYGCVNKKPSGGREVVAPETSLFGLLGEGHGRTECESRHLLVGGRKGAIKDDKKDGRQILVKSVSLGRKRGEGDPLSFLSDTARLQSKGQKKGFEGRYGGRKGLDPILRSFVRV